MDFKQLQSFVSVVRCHSFSRAAEQLFLSQPTVSAHIRSLEQELDCQLLLRTTKSLELTENGRNVYDYACRILELRDRMTTECRRESGRILQLGASTIAAAYILPRVLPEFGQAHTDTYFRIHQSDRQGVIDGILGGVFDLGLLSGDIPSSLQGIPVWTDRTVIITPVTDELLALQRSGRPALNTLLLEPMILRETGGSIVRSIERCFREMNIQEADLKVVARINDQETIKHMVAGGLGVSFISELAARDYVREKRVLSFELPFSDRRRFHLVHRKDYPMDAAVREFAHFLKAHGEYDSE